MAGRKGELEFSTLVELLIAVVVLLVMAAAILTYGGKLSSLLGTIKSLARLG